MPQTLAGLTIVLSPSGTYSGGTTINISSGDTITVADGMFTGGVVVNVAQGATVELSGVDELTGSSYTGGVAFNVAQGATVDLNGNFGGTLTGSGGGTAALPRASSSVLLLEERHSISPAASFQWTGGVMGLSAGDVTNRGTVNLSSSYESAHLGATARSTTMGASFRRVPATSELGDLGSGFTTLAVDAGGQYLLESQSGVVPHMLFNCAIDNAGTIRKTAGVGQTSLWIAGPLDNTGIIEVDSGSLFLNAQSIAQVSGNALTGGTWNVENGTTLELPVSTNITANAASISLGGAGATITGIAGLSSNSGSFSLTAGAGFKTSGDFTNSGSLTVGASSTLTVTGDETQTAAGTLTVQIGGTPASHLYGQVVITKTATLGGTFRLDLVNGFIPTAGRDYRVMSFASATGSFAAFSGLPSGMTATVRASALDLEIQGAAVNLVPTSVTAPTTATDGRRHHGELAGREPKHLRRGTDPGRTAFTSSSTRAISSSSILLGSVPHTGGLGADATYNASLTAALPALAPGYWYVLVEADSLYQIAEQDRALSTLAATTGQQLRCLRALGADSGNRL